MRLMLCTLAILLSFAVVSNAYELKKNDELLVSDFILTTVPNLLINGQSHYVNILAFTPNKNKKYFMPDTMAGISELEDNKISWTSWLSKNNIPWAPDYATKAYIIVPEPTADSPDEFTVIEKYTHGYHVRLLVNIDNLDASKEIVMNNFNMFNLGVKSNTSNYYVKDIDSGCSAKGRYITFRKIVRSDDVLEDSKKTNPIKYKYVIESNDTRIDTYSAEIWRAIAELKSLQNQMIVNQ